MADEILNSLLKEYEQKKLKAELNAEKRKEELYTKIPRLQEIEDELNHIAISTAKNILKSNTTSTKLATSSLSESSQNANFLNNIYSGTSSLEDFNKKVELLKYEKACILQNNNLSLDYLKPNYECPICQDTGYIKKDDYKSEMCGCLKQRLLDISFNKSNMSNLDKENFDTFNENLFSDEVDISKYRFNISPRTNIKNIRQKCMEFVENFDEPDTKNLLFTGNTGLRQDFYVKLYCKRIIKKRKNCFISNSTCTA